MTSSAKPTEGRRPVAPARRTLAELALRQDVLIGGGIVIAGWLIILYINRWVVGTPVLFLCLGWVSVLLVGRFLWQAGAAAVEIDGDDREGFDLSASHREELEREKKALLKAIKEVEFDHDMGKMSKEDATQIARFYRARAIEIIKEIERVERGEAAGKPATVSDLVDREVRARMALARGRLGPLISQASEDAEAEEGAGEGERDSEREREEASESEAEPARGGKQA